MFSRSCRTERRRLSTNAVDRSRWLVRLGGAALALLLGASLSFAQRPSRPRGGGPYGPRGHQQGMRAARPGLRAERDLHQHGPGFMKRLRDLPPQEQERVMANDERFQRLPPERQARIRERLRSWNALSPEERERFRARQDIFSSLSPDQRRQARGLFQQWRQLDPERRQMLMRAFRRLRDLPPAEREQFLASPEVAKRLSPEERDLLSGLGKLLPEHPPGPAGDEDPID